MEERPILKWRRTWPAEPNAADDFMATGDDLISLRIYRLVGGPQVGRWAWFAARDERSAGRGEADTPRAAAIAAETAVGVRPPTEPDRP
ncbi:hypothetical protein EYW49_21985 [Siculibacillus lacustris]|uniref:Uncharacterized protein n=1 Tax=Siculibacillus lacustris TaxID=1549641 RepID=A0A4Q9VDG1_9HYPH|nr:hypothetical protein [Siculibacillus lacustris]TBW32611.1 hypothetical protein EYW49_21985 [Siculibacillus lacustris]